MEYKVARELAWYRLDLAGVQVVRWDKGLPVGAEDDAFFFDGKGTDHHQLGTGLFFCTSGNSISSYGSSQ